MVLLLELARGLAALWVFLFHVKGVFELALPGIYQLSAYGSLGVPMFFVISGYVIACSAESCLERNKPPLAFLKARALRIYPTFWASVAIVLLTPYLVELISSFKSGVYVSPENIAAKLDLAEWTAFLSLSKVFWATTNDLQAEFSTINSVYWTLAIEFQFYIVVFLALNFRQYYRHVIAAVSVVALLLMVFPVQMNHGLFIHYWPSFSVGLGLAYLHRGGFWAERLCKGGAMQLAVVLLVSGLLIASVAMSGGGHLAFALCFGAFLWAISGLERFLGQIKKGGNRFYFWLLEPWLMLGAMSYSVYLLHGKINPLPHMFVRQLVGPGSVWYGLLIIIGTLLLCYPFYLLVERRFLSKRYKQIHQAVLTGAPGAVQG